MPDNRGILPYKALNTRKGHAASVRRQSRQRLRSERRYRRNWCTPFFDTRCKLPVLLRGGTPLPYNGWCSRYIAANDKAAGDPPGRRGCRYSQQPMPNRMYRIVRIALQSKSWIQNMGNLLL